MSIEESVERLAIDGVTALPRGSARQAGDPRPATARRAKGPRSRPLLAKVARAAFRMDALLSLRAAHRLGWLVGHAAASLPTLSRRCTRANLELCFPELPPSERDRLARRSLVELARMALELGPLWMWPRERVLGLVREVRGQALLDAALAEGRGVIMAMPHLGCWELAGLWCSTRAPMTGLYSPPRVAEMDGFYTRARQRFGARMVPAGTGGVLALRRALARREIVTILPDIDPKNGGRVFAPFFGVQANTSTLLCRLARESGAAVFLLHARRLEDGAGYRVVLTPGDPAVSGQDTTRAATALNAQIETLVRRMPEQYLWRSRRFRRRPEGEPNPYRK